MKKLLFVTRKLQTGGIEKALLETLKLLKNTDFEVTIAAIDASGDLNESFKTLAHVVDLSHDCDFSLMTKSNLINKIKRFKLFSAIKIAFVFLFEKIFCSFCKKQFYILSVTEI